MTGKLLPYIYSTRKPGHTLNIDDKECLNFATFNFLGFVGNEKIEVLNFLFQLFITFLLALTEVHVHYFQYPAFVAKNFLVVLVYVVV